MVFSETLFVGFFGECSSLHRIGRMHLVRFDEISRYIAATDHRGEHYLVEIADSSVSFNTKVKEKGSDSIFK